MTATPASSERRALDAPGPAAVLLDGAASDAAVDDVLTADALALVGAMSRVHDDARRALLDARASRAAELRAGAPLELAAATAWIRDGDWSVAPAPADLQDRRVEITGPVDRKMMVSALNCGARVFMADLEDSLSPTWANVIAGHQNVRDALTGTLSFHRPDGRVDTVVDDAATMVIRPRGLHLDERHVLTGDRPVGAAVFDVTVAAFHGAHAAAADGSGLYLYLPKLEHHHEAEWWEAVLTDLERRLGLDVGSIKVTVLVETILAAFEMDEILYALRTRIVGLNAGRWDYLFSIIKRVAGDDVLPDRGQLTMTVPFMATYARRLVAVAHRRGAHAIGGMSAFIPNRAQPAVTERALAAVRADKEREAALGYDGTWVAHPDLVPVALEVFDGALGDRPHQLGTRPDLDDAAGLIDLTVPGGQVTMAGLRANISVALRYLEAWLAGRGAVAIDDLMEDAATAEISRSQIWQWVTYGAVATDGTVITAAVVEAELAAATDRLLAAGSDPAGLAVAADLLRETALSADLVEFLTIPALTHLD